jgi:hypothetical protein
VAARTPLERLRALCLALPEAHEVEAWGEPTFRVKNKIFAGFASEANHHGAGRPGVWLKSAAVTQDLLVRAVAVVHPTRPIIGYHLLWKDDVHGAWIPFTVPTDEEIVWVGYDSSGAPTDIWTYWHGKVLHADWRGHGTPAVDVQWGKHGLMPRGITESDLPRFQTLNAFYAFHQLGILDILLGRKQALDPDFSEMRRDERFRDLIKKMCDGTNDPNCVYGAQRDNRER